jgi:hypothetical protein
MRTRMLTLVLLVLTSLSLMAGPLQAKPPAGEPDVAKQLAQVRNATARYHDVQAAVDDGYVQIPECVPQMGYHYVRMDGSVPQVAADQDSLDPLDPEILVYAPRPNGSLRLVAVEYAVWPDPETPLPTLFGQEFDPAVEGGPPFHTLHAWVWQANPAGIFEAHNPKISCD